MKLSNIIKGAVGIGIGVFVFIFLALPIVTTRFIITIRMSFYDLLENLSYTDGMGTFVGVLTILSIIMAVAMLVLGILALVAKFGKMNLIYFIGTLVAGIIFLLTAIFAMAEFSGTGTNIGAGAVLMLILGIGTIVWAIVAKLVLDRRAKN